MTARYSFAIHLPIRNEWANVDLVRTSVQNFFAAMFRDIDGCHAIAMVTGELLENAIKYGSWKGDDPSFRLSVWGEGREAHVSVESPAAAGDAGVNELVATLAWMRRFATAEEAYRAKLLEIAGGAADTSKLGLVRIAYEGGCRINAEVRGETLRVLADLSL
jgi:hypothetical protein